MILRGTSAEARVATSPAATSSDQEIEIKLELTGPAELAALARVLPKGTPAVTQYNLYFDDATEGWRGHGMSVRMRREAAAVTLTIKTKRVDQGDFVQRAEWEAPVPPACWDRLVAGTEAPGPYVRALLTAKQARVPENLACDALRPLGMSVTKRQNFGLANGLKLELDTTSYPDGTVCYEAEMEVPAHVDRARASTTLRELFDQAGVAWRVTKTTKQSRFRAALQRSR